MKVEDVPKLKVAELKAELKKLGEATNGLKAELAERLTSCLQSKVRLLSCACIGRPLMHSGLGLCGLVCMLVAS